MVSEVHTAPPNSQGAVWLMILGQLAGADQMLDPLSDRAPELVTAVQAAAEARTAYLADPRYARGRPPAASAAAPRSPNR